MVRIWIMFVCLKRRHYNKSITVWLSMINHSGTHFPQLHNLFKRWHIVVDEYPVENTHSIIRSQTSDLDTAEILSKKVKAISSQRKNKRTFDLRLHLQQSFPSQ